MKPKFDPPLPFPRIPRVLDQFGQPTSEEYDIPLNSKKQVLQRLYLFEDCPALDDTRYDLHAGKIFTVAEFKVVREGGANFLVSPYYYESGGTVIDWMPADFGDEEKNLPSAKANPVDGAARAFDVIPRMEIAAFAEITYHVLENTPLEKYIPTLCLPARGQIQALQGVPEAEEGHMREIALDWAQSTADDEEEFLVAFRDGDGFFRIIRRSDGKLQEALYPGRKKT